MVTIEGTPRKPGVAIASGAVVDARHGMGGVSPALLNEGLRALRAMLPASDYPEAVIACDTLVMGLSIRIPGVNTIGIAAESDQAVPGLEPEVPCVVGLPNLIKSISDGDILIVDGNKGVVYVDPDLETLVRYQEIEERAASGSTVYIAAEHLPAKTPDGDTVSVHAYVTDETGLAAALDQGADGVIVDVGSWEMKPMDAFGTVLRVAAGKPVSFAVENAVEEALRAAMLFAVPHQVTLFFRAEVFDDLAPETDDLLELLTADALINDLDPPHVGLGVRARDVELPQAEMEREPASILVDLRRSPIIAAGQGELGECLMRLIGGMRPERVVMLLGDRIEAVARVVEAGARTIAVAPELVGAAKMAIRSMGAGDQV